MNWSVINKVLKRLIIFIYDRSTQHTHITLIYTDVLLCLPLGCLGDRIIAIQWRSRGGIGLALPSKVNVIKVN